MESKPSVPQSEIKEELPKNEFLANAQRFGEFYSSMVNHLIGQGELDQSTMNELNPESKKLADSILTSVRRHTQEQHDLVTKRKMDATAVLRQVFNSEEQEDLLADATKYKMEELGPGIFWVHMDIELLTRLHRGAKAAAFHPEGGVCFVFTREFNDEETMVIEERELKENLPHEVNHLVWDFLVQDNFFQFSEPEKQARTALNMFQNELSSRLISDGSVAAYSHLTLVGHERLEQLRQEQPQVIESILKKVESLNELLAEIEKIRKRTDVKKHGLLLPVMEATTFDELETHLQEYKLAVQQEPATNMEEPQGKNNDSSGWGFIST